jgi:hypothetical protein
LEDERGGVAVSWRRGRVVERIGSGRVADGAVSAGGAGGPSECYLEQRDGGEYFEPGEEVRDVERSCCGTVKVSWRLAQSNEPLVSWSQRFSCKPISRSLTGPFTSAARRRLCPTLPTCFGHIKKVDSDQRAGFHHNLLVRAASHPIVEQQQKTSPSGGGERSRRVEPRGPFPSRPARFSSTR